MSEAPFGKYGFDWPKTLEKMDEQLRAFEFEKSLSCRSSISSEPDASSTSSIFGERSREAIGGMQSRTINALDLAIKEDFDENEDMTMFMWPVGWIEISEGNFPIVIKWPHTHIIGKETNADLKRMPEDTDEPQLSNFHHLNFYNKPESYRNTTPPEVSLWLTMFAKKTKNKYHSLRQLVITSQAGKLIDPVLFLGRPIHLKLHGTALRHAVTGDVYKVYHPRGTWGLDLYSSDETAPLCAKGMKKWVDGTTSRGPPRPYFVQPHDETTPAVNDDGRIHGPNRDRRQPLPGRSRLCVGQNVDDEGSMIPATGTSEEEQKLARALDALLSLRAQGLVLGSDRETSSEDEESVISLSSDDSETPYTDEEVRAELSLIFGRL